MINVSLPEQSSAGDWIESIQMLAEDDGAPCWTTVPGDLIVTMTVIPEGVSLRRDYGSLESLANAAVLTATTIDGSGQLTAFDNGFLEISVPAASMAGLAPDRHGVAKRHLVFFKIETGGYTLQFMVGVLPVSLGA
jgi:hypothetical protein